MNTPNSYIPVTGSGYPSVLASRYMSTDVTVAPAQRDDPNWYNDTSVICCPVIMKTGRPMSLWTCSLQARRRGDQKLFRRFTQNRKQPQCGRNMTNIG